MPVAEHNLLVVTNVVSIFVRKQGDQVFLDVVTRGVGHP